MPVGVRLVTESENPFSYGRSAFEHFEEIHQFFSSGWLKEEKKDVKFSNFKKNFKSLVVTHFFVEPVDKYSSVNSLFIKFVIEILPIFQIFIFPLDFEIVSVFGSKSALFLKKRFSIFAGFERYKYRADEFSCLQKITESFNQHMR